MALAACSGLGSESPDPPEFSQQHDCGYGFYAGTEDETAGLFIDFTDFEAAQAGEVPDMAQLSTGSWQADLQFGADLFANWCDDVLEPDEPTPEVEEVWEVTGTIEIMELPSAGECGPATGRLTDVVAHGPDDETLVLGELDVTNEFWGCFAG